MAIQAQREIENLISTLEKLTEVGKISDSQMERLSTTLNALKFGDTLSVDIRQAISDLSLLQNKIQFLNKGLIPVEAKRELRSFLSEYKTRLDELSRARTPPTVGENATRAEKRQINKEELQEKRINDFLEKEIARMEALVQKEAAIAEKQAKLREKLAGQGRTATQYSPLGGGNTEPAPRTINDYSDFFKTLPFGERALESITERLKQFKIQGATVKSAMLDASSGIQTFKFQLESEDGVTRQATISTDRFGRVLDSNQNKLRSFGSAIGRDVVEFLKWTIAATVILGPLRKLNELITEAIDIQSDLAQVQIATGVSAKELNTIFQESLKIANLTSSSVKGVVEGYSLAFAAAGSTADETRRFAETQVLLRDSMILSKLAGIDQKQALDTLVGGLRQTGASLTSSTSLLDAWVAVSKEANVSVNTLASSYAIVGTAAEDAGISQEKLNGIIAVISESTKLSADEVGNAIRGFISGFSTAGAEQVLGRYGIAVRRANGELRGFVELVEEIKSLQTVGILNDTDISEIANAVGGGFRRGAQFATLLENWENVTRLSEVSLNSSGAAAEAFGIQLQTLESAITRLANAFTGLAQSLGADAGFVGILTRGTDSLTALVNVIGSISEGLGKATPLLIAFASAMAFLKTGPGTNFLDSSLPSFLANSALNNGVLFNPLGNGILNSQEAARLSRAGLLPNTGATNFGGLISNISASIQGNLGRLPGIGGALSQVNPVGYIAPALIAGQQLSEGDYKGATSSVVGAVVGGLLTAGNPLGIAAGSAMASSFYENLKNYDVDIAQRIFDLQNGIPEGTPTAEEQGTLDSRLSQVQEELAKRTEDSLALGFKTWIANASAPVTNFVRGATLGNPQGRLETPTLSEEDVLLASFFNQLPSFFGNRETLDKRYGEGTADLIQEIILLTNAIEENTASNTGGGNAGFSASALTGQIPAGPGLAAVNYSAIFGPVAEKVATQLIETTLQDYRLQNANASDIATARSVGSGLGVRAGRTGLALDIAGVGYDVEALTSLLTQLQPEESSLLDQLVSDLLSAKDLAESTKKAIAGLGEDYDPNTMEFFNQQLELANKRAAEAASSLTEFVPAAASGARIRENPQFPTIDLGDVTSEQANQIEAEADRLYALYLEAYQRATGLTDEDIETIIESNQESIIKIGKGTFGDLTKTPQEYFKDAMDSLGIDGGKGGSGDRFNLVDLRDKNVNSGQLMSLYNQMLKAITSSFPQYQVDAQDVGLLFKDGFDTQHVDMTILNLAMQELIEVNKEQLSGIYNLPEGATFFVPLNAYDLSRSTIANQGGGIPNLDDIFGGTPATQPTVDPTNPYAVGQQKRLENPTYVENPPENLALLNELRRYGMLPGTIPTPPAYESIQNTTPSQITTEVEKTPTIRFHLEIASTFTVNLDGRTIADAVKAFLLDDLLRSEGGGGGITRRFVL